MSERKLWFEIRETILAAKASRNFPKTLKDLMALARETRRMIKDAFPRAA